MKIKSIIASSLALAGFALCPVVHADEVTDWNQHMLTALKTANQSPLVATAIVASSVFDAVISPAARKDRKPPPPPPPPPPTPKTVNGTVRMSVADGGAPAAGALLDVWVQTAVTVYFLGQFTTDSLGRFNISGVPNGATVQLHALYNVGLQPCAAIGQYTTTNGLTKTIELFSLETLLAGAQPPAGSSPVLSGVVRDASTQQALPHAYVEMHTFGFGDVPAAETFADASGNYFLGSVPNPVGVLALADGYDQAWYSPSISGDTTFDILLNQTQY